MMGDVANKTKTIEISAPDFFAHTESQLQTSEDECFAAWESARLKRTQVRDVGRMREYTYTYMYKKDLYFWKYDYTNLRQKIKTMRTRIMKCFYLFLSACLFVLDEFSFLVVLSQKTKLTHARWNQVDKNLFFGLCSVTFLFLSLLDFALR